MSLEINFLVSYLDYFPKNCGAVSNEHDERFDQDISKMGERLVRTRKTTSQSPSSIEENETFTVVTYSTSSSEGQTNPTVADQTFAIKAPQNETKTSVRRNEKVEKSPPSTIIDHYASTATEENVNEENETAKISGTVTVSTNLYLNDINTQKNQETDSKEEGTQSILKTSKINKNNIDVKFETLEIASELKTTESSKMLVEKEGTQGTSFTKDDLKNNSEPVEKAFLVTESVTISGSTIGSTELNTQTIVETDESETFGLTSKIRLESTKGMLAASSSSAEEELQILETNQNTFTNQELTNVSWLPENPLITEMDEFGLTSGLGLESTTERLAKSSRKSKEEELQTFETNENIFTNLELKNLSEIPLTTETDEFGLTSENVLESTKEIIGEYSKRPKEEELQTLETNESISTNEEMLLKAETDEFGLTSENELYSITGMLPEHSKRSKEGELQTLEANENVFTNQKLKNVSWLSEIPLTTVTDEFGLTSENVLESTKEIIGEYSKRPKEKELQTLETNESISTNEEMLLKAETDEFGLTSENELYSITGMLPEHSKRSKEGELQTLEANENAFTNQKLKNVSWVSDISFTSETDEFGLTSASRLDSSTEILTESSERFKAEELRTLGNNKNLFTNQHLKNVSGLSEIPVTIESEEPGNSMSQPESFATTLISFIKKNTNTDTNNYSLIETKITEVIDEPSRRSDDGEEELKQITEGVDYTVQTKIKNVITSTAYKIISIAVQENILEPTKMSNNLTSMSFTTEIISYLENVTLDENNLRHIFEDKTFVPIETAPLEPSTSGLIKRTSYIPKKINMEEMEFENITESQINMSPSVTINRQEINNAISELGITNRSEDTKYYDQNENTTQEGNQEVYKSEKTISRGNQQNKPTIDNESEKSNEETNETEENISETSKNKKTMKLTETKFNQEIRTSELERAITDRIYEDTTSVYDKSDAQTMEVNSWFKEPTLANEELITLDEGSKIIFTIPTEINYNLNDLSTYSTMFREGATKQYADWYSEYPEDEEDKGPILEGKEEQEVTKGATNGIKNKPTKNSITAKKIKEDHLNSLKTNKYMTINPINGSLGKIPETSKLIKTESLTPVIGKDEEKLETFRQSEFSREIVSSVTIKYSFNTSNKDATETKKLLSSYSVSTFENPSTSRTATKRISNITSEVDANESEISEGDTTQDSEQQKNSETRKESTKVITIQNPESEIISQHNFSAEVSEATDWEQNTPKNLITSYMTEETESQKISTNEEEKPETMHAFLETLPTSKPDIKKTSEQTITQQNTLIQGKHQEKASKIYQTLISTELTVETDTTNIAKNNLKALKPSTDTSENLIISRTPIQKEFATEKMGRDDTQTDLFTTDAKKKLEKIFEEYLTSQVISTTENSVIYQEVPDSENTITSKREESVISETPSITEFDVEEKSTVTSQYEESYNVSEIFDGNEYDEGSKPSKKIINEAQYGITKNSTAIESKLFLPSQILNKEDLEHLFEGVSFTQSIELPIENADYSTPLGIHSIETSHYHKGVTKKNDEIFDEYPPYEEGVNTTRIKNKHYPELHNGDQVLPSARYLETSEVYPKTTEEKIFDISTAIELSSNINANKTNATETTLTGLSKQSKISEVRSSSQEEIVQEEATLNFNIFSASELEEMSTEMLHTRKEGSHESTFKETEKEGEAYGNKGSAITMHTQFNIKQETDGYSKIAESVTLRGSSTGEKNMINPSKNNAISTTNATNKIQSEFNIFTEESEVTSYSKTLLRNITDELGVEKEHIPNKGTIVSEYDRDTTFKVSASSTMIISEEDDSIGISEDKKSKATINTEGSKSAESTEENTEITTGQEVHKTTVNEPIPDMASESTLCELCEFEKTSTTKRKNKISGKSDQSSSVENPVTTIEDTTLEVSAEETPVTTLEHSISDNKATSLEDSSQDVAVSKQEPNKATIPEGGSEASEAENEATTLEHSISENEATTLEDSNQDVAVSKQESSTTKRKNKLSGKSAQSSSVENPVTTIEDTTIEVSAEESAVTTLEHSISDNKATTLEDSNQDVAVSKQESSTTKRKNKISGKSAQSSSVENPVTTIEDTTIEVSAEESAVTTLEHSISENKATTLEDSSQDVAVSKQEPNKSTTPEGANKGREEENEAATLETSAEESAFSTLEDSISENGATTLAESSHHLAVSEQGPNKSTTLEGASEVSEAENEAATLENRTDESAVSTLEDSTSENGAATARAESSHHAAVSEKERNKSNTPEGGSDESAAENEATTLETSAEESAFSTLEDSISENGATTLAESSHHLAVSEQEPNKSTTPEGASEVSEAENEAATLENTADESAVSTLENSTSKNGADTARAESSHHASVSEKERNKSNTLEGGSDESAAENEATTLEVSTEERAVTTLEHSISEDEDATASERTHELAVSGKEPNKSSEGENDLSEAGNEATTFDASAEESTISTLEGSISENDATTLVKSSHGLVSVKDPNKSTTPEVGSVVSEELSNEENTSDSITTMENGDKQPIATGDHIEETGEETSASNEEKDDTTIGGENEKTSSETDVGTRETVAQQARESTINKSSSKEAIASSNESDEPITSEAVIKDNGEQVNTSGKKLSSRKNMSESTEEFSTEQAIMPTNEAGETTGSGSDTQALSVSDKKSSETPGKDIKISTFESKGKLDTHTEVVSAKSTIDKGINITNLKTTKLYEKKTKESSTNREETSIHKKHTLVTTHNLELTSTIQIDVGMVGFESTPCKYCQTTTVKQIENENISTKNGETKLITPEKLETKNKKEESHNTTEGDEEGPEMGEEQVDEEQKEVTENTDKGKQTTAENTEEGKEPRQEKIDNGEETTDKEEPEEEQEEGEATAGNIENGEETTTETEEEMKKEEEGEATTGNTEKGEETEENAEEGNETTEQISEKWEKITVQNTEEESSGGNIENEEKTTQEDKAEIGEEGKTQKSKETTEQNTEKEGEEASGGTIENGKETTKKGEEVTEKNTEQGEKSTAEKKDEGKEEEHEEEGKGKQGQGAKEQPTTLKQGVSKIETQEKDNIENIAGTTVPTKLLPKPIVIIVNNYGTRSSKLNQSVLEGILSSPINDIELHYIDLKAEETENPKIITNNQPLKLNIPFESCKKADYVNGHNCFCNIQNYKDSLVQKINNKGNIKSKKNYCENFLTLKSGLLIQNSIKPVERKRRGLIYLENLKKKGEVVEYETIDGLFEDEYLLNTSDELLLDKGNELTIHGVSVKNTGNYTCSKEDEKTNTEEQHWHELEMITFPIYNINMNIFYKFNDSCNLKTGDVLYTYLPKIIGPLLCSNENDLCSVDVKRPRCLTRADDNFYNVTMIAKLNSDFVSTLHDKCDINCKLRIYENLVNLIYKNTEILENIPVYSVLDPLRRIEFLPNINGKEGSPVTVKRPKIVVYCPNGFGLENKRQSVCVACPPHTFSGDDEAFCKTCPGGQYQPEPGSKSCIHCNSPVDNKMCLRMLYTDTKLFKIYVGAAFGFIVLMVIIVLVWTSGHKDNDNKKSSYFEGSLRHRAMKKKNPDIETGVREPLLGRSPRKPTPPQLPPVDF